MIIDTRTGKIVTVEDMYAANPEFCRNIPVILFDWYVYPNENVFPAYDPIKEAVIAPNYATYENGIWKIKYVVTPLASEVVAANLSNLAMEKLAAIDSETDQLYSAVIGNKQSEYEAAEKQAYTYVDSGYEGTPGELVQCWADIKGWTAEAAADDIVLVAQAWRAAQLDIRVARLTAKETIRQATTSAAILEAYGKWTTFLTNAMATRVSV